MHESLLAHFRRYISINDHEEKIICKHVTYRVVNNKEYILKEGQVCHANYFIVKGCFRMYLSTNTGTEQIIQFGIDNWWITDYTSLEMQKPSIYTIQAVENSEILVIDKRIQEELFSTIPQLERYFRIILQRIHSAYLMRIHYIYNMSGEERYNHFNGMFPEFVQRVPQYMLASYLGFTPEFLSKIRARKS
jgi:CRP-like cAMP-binding protein